MDCCNEKEGKKILDYVVMAVVVLLLIGSIVVVFSLSSNDKVSVKKDLDLEQYRSGDIPEECRLPIYESRIESWKEHLSHHENTWYCLDYFE